MAKNDQAGNALANKKDENLNTTNEGGVSKTNRAQNAVQTKTPEPPVSQPTSTGFIYVTVNPILGVVGKDYPMVRDNDLVDIEVRRKEEIRVGKINGAKDEQGYQLFTQGQIDRWLQGGIIKKAKKVTRQETVFVEETVDL